jgi:hypothetical protein
MVWREVSKVTILMFYSVFVNLSLPAQVWSYTWPQILDAICGIREQTVVWMPLMASSHLTSMAST